MNDTALNQIKTFAHPKKGHSAEFLIAIGEKAESTHAIRIVPSPVDYWITTTYARERAFRKWWFRQHNQLPLIQAYEELSAQYPRGLAETGAVARRTLRRDAGGDEPMTENTQSEMDLLLNGEPYTGDPKRDRRPGTNARWKRRVLILVLMIETCFALPKLAHGQFLSVFDAIFSSIQNDIGSLAQDDQPNRPANAKALSNDSGTAGGHQPSPWFRGELNQRLSRPDESGIQHAVHQRCDARAATVRKHLA